MAGGGKPALTQAAADLNRVYWGPTFSVISDSTVLVNVALEAQPLVCEHLRRCLSRFCDAVEGWGGELVELVGKQEPAVEPTATAADQSPGHVDGEDFMTAVIALEEVLRIGDLDSSRVAALFDWSIDRLRVALAELAFAGSADPLVAQHLRRGMRRALRRSLEQTDRSVKPAGGDTHLSARGG